MRYQLRYTATATASGIVYVVALLLLDYHNYAALYWNSTNIWPFRITSSNIPQRSPEMT